MAFGCRVFYTRNTLTVKVIKVMGKLFTLSLSFFVTNAYEVFHWVVNAHLSCFFVENYDRNEENYDEKMPHVFVSVETQMNFIRREVIRISFR